MQERQYWLVHVETIMT